jgi:hypothetical protein
MKVYNLACHLDHHFEGWFASEADALSQQETGLLTCPVCDSKEIVRLPSAPRISKRASRELVPANQAPAQANKAADVNSSADQSMVLTGSQQSHFQAQVQATVMKAMRELINKAEDVGRDFAEDARNIHYQEAPERSIRGHATVDETAELREEGIEVVSLPVFPALKDTLQ